MSEPLPNDVVATIRLPLAIDKLIGITNALKKRLRRRATNPHRWERLRNNQTKGAPK